MTPISFDLHQKETFIRDLRKTNGNNPAEKGEQDMKKSLSGKIAFGIGGAAKDMVYTLSAYYLMYYYQNVLDLSPAFVGTVLMAARLFDALNDPVMGVLVARTRSRWGRLRPWIFSGSILNAFMLYALFAAPDVPETGIMVWFTVVYLLWGITYTMLDIPYWSMIPAAAETVSDRENLAVIGRTC
ncbi:MAG: MFS transporter, partial [Bacteroidaceae bacterium]|nr:MFS transporter [Bacteroidaceae bacterium]